MRRGKDLVLMPELVVVLITSPPAGSGVSGARGESGIKRIRKRESSKRERRF